MADNSPNGMPVMCSVWEGDLKHLCESPCYVLQGYEEWGLWEIRSLTCQVPMPKLGVNRRWINEKNVSGSFSPEQIVRSFTCFASESYSYDYTPYFWQEWNNNGEPYIGTPEYHDYYSSSMDVSFTSGSAPPFYSLHGYGNHRYRYVSGSIPNQVIVYTSESYFNYYNYGNIPNDSYTSLSFSENSLTAVGIYDCTKQLTDYPWFGDTFQYTGSLVQINSYNECDYTSVLNYCHSRTENPTQSLWNDAWANNRNFGRTYGYCGYSIDLIKNQTMPTDSFASSSGVEGTQTGSAGSSIRIKNGRLLAWNGFNYTMDIYDNIYNAGARSEHFQLRYTGATSQSYVIVEMPMNSIIGQLSSPYYSGSNYPYLVVSSGSVAPYQIIDIPPNKTIQGKAYIKDFGGNIKKWPMFAIHTYIFIQDDPNAPPQWTVSGNHPLERVYSW